MIDTLSDRELDVFRLIGQGVKTAEIAARLHLSIKTVETYRERIRTKLDLSDGAKLGLYAMQWVHKDPESDAQGAKLHPNSPSHSGRDEDRLAGDEPG